jgi:hypothetical protein
MIGMTNLPDKTRPDVEIKGVVIPVPNFFKTPGSQVNYCVQVYKRDPTESDAYEICSIVAATPQGMADQIAAAIRNARDIGFEQGRRYVREALGIKN